MDPTANAASRGGAPELGTAVRPIENQAQAAGPTEGTPQLFGAAGPTEGTPQLFGAADLDSKKKLEVILGLITHMKSLLEKPNNDDDTRNYLQALIDENQAKLLKANSLALQIHNQVHDQINGFQHAHPVLGDPGQQQHHDDDDGAGSESSDGDSLMVDLLADADEQQGGNVAAPAPANNVTDFTEARADPSKDPRTKKLGPRWMSDKDMSEIVTHSDMNPHGKGVAPYEVNATNRDKYMGSRQIDPTLSGLTEKRHMDVLQLLGKQLFGGPKQPEVIRKNDDGVTFSRLVSTILNGRPPADAAKSLLNLLMGRAQGGKAQEAVNDCWAKFFVHATLPIYYVRNCGGLGDAPQTVDDFKEFNAKIDTLLDNASRWKPEKFGWLNNQAERDKFKLNPRMGKGNKTAVDKCGLRGQINGGIGLVVELDRTSSINQEWRTEDEYVVKLAFPQVIVALTNQSHFKSFMEHGLVLKEDTYTLSTGLTLTKAQMTDAIKKKFTPFDIVAGKNSETHMIRSGRKNVSVFEITLHSAYPPWAWDMTKPYDASGYNAPRLRYARCIDEIDASRSENPVHKVNALTYQSREVADKFGEALNPEAFKKQKNAQEGKRKEAARIAASEKRIDKAKRDLAKLQQGEEPEADQQTARADRLVARGANHDEAQVRAQGAQWDDGDESMSEEDEDAESTSDDDESSQAADDDCSAEMQALVESEQQRIVEMMKQLAEQEEARNSFLEQEREALAAAACNHVTGMQSSAAFNVGVTATIFGCLQQHDGGPTLLRVVKMPTPDAYNDLCYYSPEHNELRMLINPEKRAGPGDIKIIESDIRSIGLRNVKSHRNEYIDAYIVQNGLCELDAAGAPKMEVWPNGKMYPAKPAEPLQPRSRGASRCSYRISQEWLEANTLYPWVREMMQSFEKAAKVTPRRLQNMWERNSELFTTMVKELQKQRLPLRAARRVAQGLVISYETRNTRMKDILIGNLFTKLGKAPGAWADGSLGRMASLAEDPNGESEPMHQVSCYNFSHEGVKLIFDPNQLDREELQFVLNHAERLLSPLREYLKEDPRIKPKHLTGSALKGTYIDKITGTDDRPGLADWVERHLLGAGVLDQWEKECAELRRDNPNAVVPPKPRGDLFFKDWQLPLYNDLTRNVEGHYSLVTLNFAGCKQPRFVATLFTLLDALCAAAVLEPWKS
jgi:hypothetical protein